MCELLHTPIFEKCGTFVFALAADSVTAWKKEAERDIEFSLFEPTVSSARDRAAAHVGPG